MRRRARKASCPGLSPQVEFTRLAALNAAELGQARVPVASTSCFVDAAKTWMAGPSPAMTERVGIHLQRRELVALFVGGMAATWPLAARAQQAGKVWRIGFLTSRSRPGTAGHDAFSDAFMRCMRELRRRAFISLPGGGRRR
jgi:hypothetical protein